jgi:hypothetical protein
MEQPEQRFQRNFAIARGWPNWLIPVSGNVGGE